MGKAVICPLCGGEGVLFERKGAVVKTVTCHGCFGRGWVEVSEG